MAAVNWRRGWVHMSRAGQDRDTIIPITLYPSPPLPSPLVTYHHGGAGLVVDIIAPRVFADLYSGAFGVCSAGWGREMVGAGQMGWGGLIGESKGVKIFLLTPHHVTIYS